MRILITGGTGSLGKALVARWHKTHDLTILSRNPHRQLELQAKYGLDSSCFILADICDYEAVLKACQGQDVVIHAAALKVLSQGEQHPEEYTRVNVLGTQTVIKAWQATRRKKCPSPRWITRAWRVIRRKKSPSISTTKRFLYINSDKSVAPVNTYGMTKGIGERMVLNAGGWSLRYGNVVESEGSFIHKWKDQIEKGLPITVRQPPPTRFFVSMAQAVDLVEACLALMEKSPDLGRKILIPNRLRAFRILDVAKCLTRQDNIINEPLLPGEKIDEVLLSPVERPVWENELLSTVGPHASTVVYPGFDSHLAPRMTGDEVLASLGISRQQEVFT